MKRFRPPCGVDGCNRPRIRHTEWCSIHILRPTPSATLTDKDSTRFWRKMHKSNAFGCWLWMGETDRNGYGRWDRGRDASGKRIRLVAHRVAYTLNNGPPPADKPFILHTCDFPRCCNPDHLYAGTQKDNVRDTIARGRRGRPTLPRTLPEEWKLAKMGAA